jgi:hypothetical protein
MSCAVVRTPAEVRDLLPGGGQSAWQAGARLQAFLAGLRGLPGPVAVTDGGVMAELLRTLLGEDACRPACWPRASRHYTIDELNPVVITSVSHLRSRLGS